MPAHPANPRSRQPLSLRIRIIVVSSDRNEPVPRHPDQAIIPVRIGHVPANLQVGERCSLELGQALHVRVVRPGNVIDVCADGTVRRRVGHAPVDPQAAVQLRVELDGLDAWPRRHSELAHEVRLVIAGHDHDFVPFPLGHAHQTVAPLVVGHGLERMHTVYAHAGKRIADDANARDGLVRLGVAHHALDRLRRLGRVFESRRKGCDQRCQCPRWQSSRSAAKPRLMSR